MHKPMRSSRGPMLIFLAIAAVVCAAVAFKQQTNKPLRPAKEAAGGAPQPQAAAPRSPGVAPPTPRDAPQQRPADPPPSAAEPATPAIPTLAEYTGVSVIAVSPGTARLATFRRDKQIRPPVDEIRLWDGATGRLLQTLPQPHQADALAISPDGRWLLSMGRVRTQAELKMWDLNDGSVRASVNILESFGSVSFADDSATAWCLCPSDGFRVLDVPQGAFTPRSFTDRSSSQAVFSASQRMAAIKCNTSRGGGAVQWVDVFDLDAGTLVRKIDMRVLIGSFALSPDGGTVALGFRDRIDLHDSRSGAKTGRIDRQGVNAPQRLLYSPDGGHLIELPFGADVASPVIHDLKAGTRVKLDTRPCLDWGFGPGQRLLVASEHDAVRAFELNGKEVRW